MAIDFKRLFAAVMLALAACGGSGDGSDPDVPASEVDADDGEGAMDGADDS
jgi:hypothetical protein